MKVLMLANNFDFQSLYHEAKFWVSIIAGGYFVFKAYDVVHKTLTNDIPHLQEGIDSLKYEMSDQTRSIVKAVNDNTGEIKELRRDLFSALIEKK